jgi:hypothetical protein
MSRLRALLADRKRRQRGSILSSVLIIVAFLSILVGALMTELTSAFLISRTLVTRVQNEATVSSAVELGIHQLQGGTVPPVCARDGRGPWFLTLNGSPAAVTQACTAIVPDVATGLASGAFMVDGVHDTTAGRDRYIVTSSAGWLYGYSFGSTAASWAMPVGGPPTAPPMTKSDPNGSVDLLVPVANPGSNCAGHCVAAYDDSGGTPSFRCNMPASTTVTTTPSVEVSASGLPNFPDYAFFGGSGVGGLYVYNAADDGGCGQLASASLGTDEGAAGAPLVFPGTVTSKNNLITTNDEIFALVADGTNTYLEHWRYTETVDNTGSATHSLSQVGNSLLLTGQVGGRAVGYAINSTVPASGANLTLAIAGTAGRVATVRIAVGSGPSYTMSTGASAVLPGAASRPPYWCHCPGQDLIGVGSTNGDLYLLDTGLALKWSYDGQPDGWPAINTTPAADANGDWYFGANDGYVYDVEIPASGPTMFKAARFGPGGAILSSPVVGGDTAGCSSGPCVYFASSTAGIYFARLGGTRIIDLRACVSSASASITCAANPRLWARVEVGSPAIVGGRGVYVQGWSYYSP